MEVPRVRVCPVIRAGGTRHSSFISLYMQFCSSYYSLVISLQYLSAFLFFHLLFIMSMLDNSDSQFKFSRNYPSYLASLCSLYPFVIHRFFFNQCLQLPESPLLSFILTPSVSLLFHQVLLSGLSRRVSLVTSLLSHLSCGVSQVASLYRTLHVYIALMFLN